MMPETRSVQFRVFFPEEIINEILLNLPIKSLLRFKAVCKSWKSLITSSIFTESHFRIRSSNGHGSCLILATEYIYYYGLSYELIFSLHFDNPKLNCDEYTKLTNPMISYQTDHDFGYAGTCNGLVCLASQNKVIVWNPCIKKFLILPPVTSTIFEPLCIVKCNMAYDSSTNSVKVLRTLFRQNGMFFWAEVWSLAKGGSWKIVGEEAFPSYYRCHNYLEKEHVIVNGALHWMSDSITCIVSFDMSSEVFRLMMIPEAVVATEDQAQGVLRVFMSRHRECLTLLVENYGTFMHVWVMKEYGVVESWTKLSTLCLRQTIFHPLGFRRRGDHDQLVVFNHLANVQLLDPLTGEVMSESSGDECRYTFMDSFVESFILADHPHAISY